MICGHDDHQLIGADGGRRQAARPTRRLDEAEIGVAGCQRFEDAAGVRDLQLDGAVRVGMMNPDQPSGQQPLGDGEAGGHA